MSTAPKIAAEGIGREFASKRGRPVVALDDVSIQVGDGEFVSIVGPSGCGKSTLLAILAGLMRPTSGAVAFEGESGASCLGRVGYKPQSDLLMPWRTLIDNTILGLEVGGIGRKKARDRARQEVRRFGLEGFEDNYPDQLSGGMRQRAALLRTFLAGSDVMLLDEPFGALDSLTRLEMQEWLLEVWGASRTSILFVTHDVEEAVFLSDRVYVMSARPGTIELMIGVPFARPRTRRLVSDPEFAKLKEMLLERLHASGRAEQAAG